MISSAANNHLSRRSLIRGALGLGGTAALGGSLAACGGSGSATAKVGGSLDEIISLAKKEGHVQLIAYPKTWANYGGSFKAFTKKYGVQIQVANPNGSSAEELEAVKKLKGQSKQPDVLDIGYTFTAPAISNKLLDKYKPSTWDSIPDNFKDPDGYWVAAYYGVIQMGVNIDRVPVPQKFSDLLKPAYRKAVALPGDPREGASSVAGVFAASLAMGGSVDDILPGIKFFAELKKAGNLVTPSSVTAGLIQGQSALAFDWNYNFLGNMEQVESSGITLKTVVPADGVFGNYYAQPCTISSPQPNAARLWIEWLNSPEGAEQYALGGAIPSQYVELTTKNKLSKEAVAKLPEPDILKQLKIPNAEQGTKAAKVLQENWGPLVANA